ncbi:MAG: MATE family efflux transporter [Synergistaceae bacterium]|nr:MATE family efflux transporter [Synergistaceae bacterium]
MDQEKIPKLLLSFALPAMIGMLAGAIYNIVDRIFVGQFVGANGLAAITLSFPTMILMFAFSLLISVGGSSRVSILRGARKRHPAEQALAHTFMLLALVGFAGMALSINGVDFLLRISGASDEILPLARNYLRIILIGGPLALLGHGINSLIRACGSPRYAMGTQVLGAFSNVILDAIFIMKMGMGVEGAALGTVIAQGCATVCGLAYFLFGNTPLRIRLHFLLRPRFKVVRKICAVGSASFIVELSFFLYMTVMNHMIHAYGGNIALSAMGIFFSLDSLLFLPAMAIGEATQPIVGYNYGAGEPERVLKTIKTAILLSTCFYVLSFILAELFAKQMMMLFSSDPELLAVGIPGMRIGYLGIMFVGVPIVTNAALQGMAKAKESLVLSLLRHAVFMFLPMMVLPNFFGLWGIWMSFPTGDICGCILALFFLKRLFRWLRSPEALVVR